MIRASVPTNCLSQNFDYGDLRSGQFSGQKSARGIKLIITRLSDLRTVSMTQEEIWPNYLSFEVIIGQMRFLPLTSDGIEIEQCGWAQCVSLAETHRLICSVTWAKYLGQNVTSHVLDLWSNFDLDFSRSKCIYVAASRQEKHDGVRIISLAYFV